MRLGFEIEVEDTSPFYDVPGIETTRDGSLRNGVEYVSHILPDEDFALHLYDYMYNRIDGNYSDRCGFHFHMDFTRESDILPFLERYIRIERTLFARYPELLRMDNSFCNLLLDSPEELNIIRCYTDYFGIFDDFSKYTALNLKPLSTIGTVEFRAAKAGLTPDQFNELLSIFTALRDLAAPLPLANSITPEDAAEATSVINLLHEPITSDSEQELGDYLEEHFVEARPLAVLTESDIRNFLTTNQ